MTVFWNFLFLRIVTVAESHLWVLAVSWLVLVLLGMWSLFSRPMGAAQRLIFATIIIFLPVIGLTAYVLSCLISSEWEMLRQMGFFSKSKAQVAKSIQDS